MNYVFVGLVLILGLASSIITPSFAVSPALFLTPLIKQNKLEEARNQSLVNPSLFLNLTSYSGFLTIDERNDSNTFFWYFPVVGRPVNETPWIVWLQDGDGGSGLVGLFDEIGPFEYNEYSKDNYTLNLRKYSWGNEHSVVFIDSPIGAGFSFTNSENGFARDVDTCATHVYSALQQLVTVFPELRQAPLYLAGESNAGRHAPTIAVKILEAKPGDLAVNLQGLIMGNPVTDHEAISKYTSVAHQWGLVDAQGALAAEPLQDAYAQAVRGGNGSEACRLRAELFAKLEDMTQNDQFSLRCSSVSSNAFLSRDDVRDALHVGGIKFSATNSTVHEHMDKDFLLDVRTKIETLLEHYKILIYCGQWNMLAPCVPSAEARRKTWHWKGREEFLNAPRTPWAYNKTKLSGYVKSGGGLTEVLVEGAGRLVPGDRPAELQQLIANFIKNQQLPTPASLRNDSVETPKYAEPSGETIDTTGKATDTGRRTAGTVDINTDSGVRTGMIVSVVINVILALIVGLGVVFYVRWKKRNEAFYYSVADTNSDDIFLS